MTRKELILSLSRTYTECMSLVELKNADYAGEGDPFKNFRFSELVEVTPEKAILVRMCDKLARISNVIDNGTAAVKDETVSDTLIDLINYAAILRAYLADQRTKVLEKEGDRTSETNSS